jgi:predicted secreted protein
MNNIAEVKSFTIEQTAELMDASKIGTTWRDKITGLKGWSATIEAHFDATDPGQLDLTEGATLSLAALTANDGAEVAGSGIVRSVSVSVAHDQVVAATFTVDGDGELSFS